MCQAELISDERDGVALTDLDQPLFDGADATKQDLVDYLDTMRDRIIRCGGTVASVMRIWPGQEPFMQKICPSTRRSGSRPPRCGLTLPAGRSPDPLVNDRRTLVWFANQRAVEYHAALAWSAMRGIGPPI